MGFVAVFIVMQVIGYLVHEVMMADTYVALAANVAAIWFVSVVVSLTIVGGVFAAIYKPSGG